MMLSPLPLASICPSGLNATLLTQAICPVGSPFLSNLFRNLPIKNLYWQKTGKDYAFITRVRYSEQQCSVRLNDGSEGLQVK